MKLTIAICTRGRPDKLRTCLAHLAATDFTHVGEVLVIDQSAEPASDLPAFAQLRYVHRPDSGLSRARNQAIRMATGDVIACTDDDCYATPDWASQIVAALAAHPGAAGIYGRVLPFVRPGEDVTLHHYQTAFGYIPFATRPDGSNCSALMDSPHIRLYRTPVMPYEHLGSGNNMAFPRTTFARHGLFIEELGAGGRFESAEDVEFHYRLMRAGCPLLYHPGPLIHHDGWMSAQRNADLQDVYTIGSVTVWLGYALRGPGEVVPREYMHHRFGTIRSEASTSLAQPTTRKPRSYYLNRAVALARGIRGALWLSRNLDRAIPLLAAS